MQQTFYRPDEVEGTHQLWWPSSMQSDHNFADNVCKEETPLLVQPLVQGWKICKDILYFTSERRWVLVIWALEVPVLLTLCVILYLEFERACEILPGGVLYCQLCGQSSLLAWNSVWVYMWSLNLFVYVLLISRGFGWSLGSINCVIADNRVKGIPGVGVLFFLLVSVLQVLWFVVGIVVVISTNHCLTDRLARPTPRSALLFWTTLVALVLYPVFYALGRILGASDSSLPSEKRQMQTKLQYQ